LSRATVITAVVAVGGIRYSVIAHGECHPGGDGCYGAVATASDLLWAAAIAGSRFALMLANGDPADDALH